MKRLLLITLLIGYIYPCVAQDKPIRTEESLEGTVIYKKTTTFEVDGYTYQCDVDDGSQFVTLYNKENKLTYEKIVYKDTGKTYIGSWSSNVIEYDMDISDNDYLFMATKNGIVKKTPCREFANIRKNGIQAMTLRDDDELIEVKLTDDTTEVMMVTKLGMCIRFKATDVRPTGRSAMGVIGMNLMDTDEVVGVQLNTQGDTMLIVSENGMGKKTDISEYAVQHRGGKGVKCYKITEKTGNVIGAKAVDDTREVMLITTEGIIIRLACRDISTLGRITSGVKLINLDDNVKVATVSKVRKSPSGDDGNETEEFDAESDSENIDGVNKVNENTSDSNTSDVADDSIDRLLDAANKDNQED